MIFLSSCRNRRLRFKRLNIRDRQIVGEMLKEVQKETEIQDVKEIENAKEKALSSQQ